MDPLTSGFFDLLKPLLVILIVHSTRPVVGGIALNGRINARTYDGFQFLEPALIPAGSYISLTGIMPTIISNSTSTNSPSLPNNPAQNELISALLGALDGLVANTGGSRPISGRRRRSAAVPARAAGGIRPLTMMRLPMGIFISDQSTDAQHDNLLQQPGAAKSRLTSGLRKIIQRLRQSAENGGRQRVTFNYARTFNGLIPIEPVYIPRGYFIPLTKLQGQMKQEASASEASKPFAEIEPLTVTQLSGGVFIPHRMPALPSDIPPQILPSEIKPTHPATDSPDFPTFPSPKPQDIPLLPPPKPAVFEDPQTTKPSEMTSVVSPSVTAVSGIASDTTGVPVTATTVTSTVPATVISNIPVTPTSVISTVPTTSAAIISVTATTVTSTVPTTVISRVPVTPTSIPTTNAATISVTATSVASTVPSAVSSTIPVTATSVTSTVPSTVTSSIPVNATSLTSTVPTTVVSTFPVTATTVTSTVPTIVTSAVPVNASSVTSSVAATIPATAPVTTSTLHSTPVSSILSVSSIVASTVTKTTVTATGTSVAASLPASATTATSSGTLSKTSTPQPPMLGPPTPPASIVAQSSNPAPPIGQAIVRPMPSVPSGTEVYPEFPADAADLFGEEDVQDIIQQLLATINGTQLQGDDSDMNIPTFPSDDTDNEATSPRTTSKSTSSTAKTVAASTSSVSTSPLQTTSKSSTTSGSSGDADDILDFDPQNTQSPGIAGTDAPPLPPDPNEEDPTAATNQPAFLQSLNLTVLLPPGLQIRTRSATVYIQIPPETALENHEI